MDPLKPLIDALYSEGRPRVWSLVITVFGDSVQHRGGRIETARLGRLLGRVAVETGALRTALSRLARDGWVVGQRAGRTSSYALTEAGLERFTAATARIYAPPRQGPVSQWNFEAGAGARGLPVAGGLLSPAGDSLSRDVAFRLTGTLDEGSLAAVRAGLEPSHRAALRAMGKDVQAIENNDFRIPLDAAAARTLLVHRWRRLVLRWPEVPADVMPADIFDGDLHDAVARQYARLTPPTEAWLDTAMGESPAMPSASKAAANRFKPPQNP